MNASHRKPAGVPQHAPTPRRTPTSQHTPGVDYHQTSERFRYEDVAPAVREAADVALGSPVVRASSPVTSGFTNAYAGRVLLSDGRQAFLKATGPEFPWPVRALRREAQVLAALSEQITAVPTLRDGGRSDHLNHFDLRPDNLLIGRKPGETRVRAYVLDWNWVTLGPAWCDWVGVLPTMQAQGRDLGDLLECSPLSRSADPHALDVLSGADRGLHAERPGR